MRREVDCLTYGVAVRSDCQEMDFELDCGPCRLRLWRRSDKASLIKHANNHKIWQTVRDLFPHPYRDADAEVFLARRIGGETKEKLFAIDIEGEAVGGIGLHPRVDVERYSAELGYWLGEAFWNRGIATAAVIALCRHAFAHFDLYRIFATVFASNPASMRVLEKAGFEREGILKRAVLKAGVLMDSALYARTQGPSLPYLEI